MTPRTRTAPRSTPLRSPQRTIGAFLGAAVVAVLLVAPSLVARTFVPRLTVENPTAFDLNIDVASVGSGGWIALGTVGRESQSVIEEVADPGGTWVFRFSHAGSEGTEVTVPRADLGDRDWTISVPAEVGERLAGAGYVPSAR